MDAVRGELHACVSRVCELQAAVANMPSPSRERIWYALEEIRGRLGSVEMLACPVGNVGKR
jgi:hypothetical protein